MHSQAKLISTVKRDAPIAKEKVEEMEKIALKKVERPKELEKKVVKVVKTVE